MVANVKALDRDGGHISHRRTGRRINISESILGGVVAVVDALVLVALALSVYFVYVGAGDGLRTQYSIAIVLAVYAVMHAFHAAGLYKLDYIVAPRRQFMKIVGACALAFFLLAATAFLFKASASFSRVWAIGWLATAIVGLAIWRSFLAGIIEIAGRRGWLTHRVVIFGTDQVAHDYVANLRRMARPWIEIVGVYDDRTGRVGPVSDLCAVSGGLDELLERARSERADEIFVALPWCGNNNRIDDVVKRLSVLPARVALAVSPSLARYLNKGVNHEFGVPVVSIFERPMTGWQAFMKRMFDFVFAGTFMLVMWPVFALIALAIRLDSPGPVFFRQDRFGFNDELIPVWKFRTMYADQTDQNAERLATADDPRITRVGAFLRRTSLDELPQLLNVLNGSMSLVGPRPHATRAKADGRLYQEVIECYASRHRVKPGLTGWAQVNGWRGETDTEEKIVRRVEHDLEYISNWSLWLDIKILFRTLGVVVQGENAY